jgi:adenylate cyclase
MNIRYGKAGIHSGHVTVAEIGLYKRGIEYLSDVLNTAARIQGMCNQFEVDLLISGEVYEYFSDIPDLKMKAIENVQLKGKQQKVQI